MRRGRKFKGRKNARSWRKGRKMNKRMRRSVKRGGIRL